jgi:nucleoside-diphosphate-sugar epimerase
MRIFLTGATGYVGAAVLEALLRGGHTITALVRDSEKAERVAARGAHPVIGNLGDVESFRGAAEAQDGYVHTALDSVSGRGPTIEKLAVETLLAVAKRPRTARASKDKRFVIFTSGVWILGKAPDPIAEDAPPNPIAIAAHRPEHERMVLEAATERLRTMVVRPGVVYGGGSGMVGEIFKSATNGLVRVVGDGSNRWPLVYDHDLADLYAKLVVNDDASGIYHCNDEGDERVNEIVSAISPYVPVRPDVRHVPIEEARTKMGPYADALALDQVVRSPRARALGWTPTLHSVAGNAARLLEEWRASRD